LYAGSSYFLRVYKAFFVN